MTILITGAAGFIGMHVAAALLERGERVVGIDNFTPYYSLELKRARIAHIEARYGDLFKFKDVDFGAAGALSTALTDVTIDRIVHLGAQPGVRYSLENPAAYIHSNISGHVNILELARHRAISHLVYASSSSVYGANTTMPFSVHQSVDHPVSLYAATKKANELMAHSYAHLYRLPVTGLRFFTVYGPWGRPDMSMFLFTSRILKGEPIDVFNHGRHSRDFTYIDDIVEGVVRTLDQVATPNPEWSSADPDPGTSNAPYRLYNIGNNQPVELMHLITCIEKALGRTAEKRFLPMQPGDVPDTYADIEALTADVGFRPATPIEVGVERFVAWYKTYYGHN